ncbi:MAG: hypothetical protein LBS62_02125 [Clostridiales bacterium]|jgi:N-glycosylase/DNA lyase|nr:hypothetical protein [Clostridiales bacterium]
MEYMKLNDGIFFKQKDFDLEDTFECGQCFRFSRLADKFYRVYALGRRVDVSTRGDGILLTPCDEDEFENLWADYFDLREDYGAIKESLAMGGGVMSEAVKSAPGIRILNQDVWECLISFIISQNNNIPRIKSIIERISERYGSAREDYYAFPGISELNSAEMADLMKNCGTGFRAKYILAAARWAAALEPRSLARKTTAEARAALTGIYGVGPKVADCVLLFSLRRKEAFPVDTWVKKIMREFYFDGKDAPLKDIQQLAMEKYGQYAGCAQQYLFHYARSRGN